MREEDRGNASEDLQPTAKVLVAPVAHNDNDVSLGTIVMHAHERAVEMEAKLEPLPAWREITIARFVHKIRVDPRDYR